MYNYNTSLLKVGLTVRHCDNSIFYSISIMLGFASSITFFLLFSYFFGLIALDQGCNITLAGSLFIFYRCLTKQQKEALIVRYEYRVISADLAKTNSECNTMGQEGWELATALPYSRSDCCNQSVPTVVLIFKRPT